MPVDRTISGKYRVAVMTALGVLTVVLWLACMLFGSVDIPSDRIVAIVFGLSDGADEDTWRTIILMSRLPATTTAMLAGMALALAGLQMQTTFNNPLAGPSILGVSTGSSLGVAVVLLASGGAVTGQFGIATASILGAILGAGCILLLLLGFSRIVKSTAMLLIVGIIIGYLASSLISLLNFFATQEGVHSFVIWGMGSFGGMTLERLGIFAPLCIIGIAASFLYVKPLDAMLLGDNYARNLGVNVRRTRNALLLLAGGLTALVTAFCGPIGFIGLVVPHIARLIIRTSSHIWVVGATALSGSAIMLLCQLISVMPQSRIIPINAITPLIGAPIIIYIIVNRNKIFYLR